MKREKQISYNRPDAVEVLPESPELEKAVLGALVLESDNYPTWRRSSKFRRSTSQITAKSTA